MKGEEFPPRRSTKVLSESSWATWVLALACLYTLLTRGAHILTAEYSLLLRIIEDDTYYYLQPAWNLKEKGIYSFDGVGKTYGFQPLWMIAVTALSWVSSNKEVFLRLTLLASVVLFVASGVALYRLARRDKNPLAAAVGVSAFWLLNPWLADVFTRGKENAIHALVLLLSTLSAHFILTRPRDVRSLKWAMLGALLGLMLLARVNNVLFIATLVGLFIWRNGWLSLRPGPVLLALGAMLVVTAPWFVYAQLELGTTFPTSGSAKLKAVRPEQLMELLSWNSVSRISRSIVGLYRDLFPPLLVTLFAWAWVTRLRKKTQGPMPFRERFTGWLRRDPATALLVSYAMVNIGATFVLLNPWFDYGIWYRVPEQCASVLLVTRAFSALFSSASVGEVAPSLEPLNEPSAAPASFSESLTRGLSLRSPLGASLAASVVLWSLLFRLLVPAEEPPYRGWQDRIYEAVASVPELIPKGASIGAWNGGLIGYLLDDYTVYNLDGLANTREFLDVIGPNVGGLRLTPDHRNLAAWLAEHDVEYIIDFMDLDELDKPPCFALIGFNRCRVLKTVGLPLPFGSDRTLAESILELGPYEPPGGTFGL